MTAYDAYVFDVQGTLFDFYTPVADALSPWVDRDMVGDVVRAWRRDYFSRTASLRQSASEWRPVQDAYRDGLSAVIEEFGLDIPDAVLDDVAAAWKRLTPWPDVVAGVGQLRRSAVVATLSNTDMSTMVHLFKKHEIGWDAVLTAEVFGAFKPEPYLYERTCRYLGVPPERAAMVASHPYDLRAARELGMGTVFVYRPLEFGRVGDAVDDVDGEFDHRITDIRDVP
jgi:2-haloacid dehalogenase